jgi:DNA replication protein DnaC
MTAREVDVHKLPAMLTALRLPSFHVHWQNFAERADKEGWSAAKFLAALAECELAERETRQIQRHLAEAKLPGGKTLATFDFKVLPDLPRRRIEALAAGDWIDSGTNLVAIGNSGAGKTHVLCAIGHALIEAGFRVLYTRTTDLVQKLQAARRDLVLEAALAKLDKFHLLILDDITYPCRRSLWFSLRLEVFDHRQALIRAQAAGREFVPAIAVARQAGVEAKPSRRIVALIAQPLEVERTASSPKKGSPLLRRREQLVDGRH